MKPHRLILVTLGLTLVCRAEQWSLDNPADPTLRLQGEAQVVAGVEGKALQLDGHSVIDLADSARLNSGTEGFTVSVWVNPLAIGGVQRMVAAKNRYSIGESQRGVMVNRDGKDRSHVQQSGWKTLTSSALASWWSRRIPSSEKSESCGATR